MLVRFRVEGVVAPLPALQRLNSEPHCTVQMRMLQLSALTGHKPTTLLAYVTAILSTVHCVSASPEDQPWTLKP